MAALGTRDLVGGKGFFATVAFCGFFFAGLVAKSPSPRQGLTAGLENFSLPLSLAHFAICVNRGLFRLTLLRDPQPQQIPVEHLRGARRYVGAARLVAVMLLNPRAGQR